MKKIGNITNELSDIDYFLEKHIIQDLKNLNKNKHLHFYIKKMNLKLEEFIKDKGINLLLKINSPKFMILSQFGENSAFNSIDKNFRIVGLYSILISSELLRFEILHKFSNLTV